MLQFKQKREQHEPQKIQTEKKPKQLQNIFQNLNKQSALSHNHSQIPSSQRDKTSAHNDTNIQSPSTRNQSIDVSHKKKQALKFQDVNNQFFNELQISQKIAVNGYFDRISKDINKKKLDQVVTDYLSKIQDNLEQNISQGTTKIQKHRQDIKNLLTQFKMSDQQLKILEKKANIEVKKQKIKLLDPFQQQKGSRVKTHDQSNDSLQKLTLNNILTNSILTKQQHRRLIQKFRISNKLNQQKHKQKLFSQQERERSLQYQRKAKQQETIKRNVKQKREMIEMNLAKRKLEHSQFVMRQKSSQEKYQSMKKRQFLYEKMEDKFKSQILIPVLEEKKQKLKEIRDFRKRYDITEIKKHEQDYLEKKSTSSAKKESRHKIATFHYNPPERSKRLAELLQQQKCKAKIKFQQKKRILQQNKLRQINFLSDIKLKFKPHIDEKKKQEIQKRLKSEQSKPKSEQKDVKLLGMRYFEEAKKVIKRPKQKTEASQKNKTEGNQLSQRNQQHNQFINDSFMIKIKPNRPQKRINLSFSQNSNHKININQYKRKEIKKIINSDNLQRQQKLERLKIQNQKISEIYKRKEKFFQQHEDDQKTRQQAIGLLLNSIQTKMGIIDICTKE